MKSAGLEDVVRQKADPGGIVRANGGDAMNEFPVFEEGDLPLHFRDGLFDTHFVSI
jgi:hypothetical protein